MTVVFRALTALSAVAGIVALLLYTHDGTVFVYFTVQSSVIIAVVSALATVRPVAAWVRGGATLFSCITGSVYHTLLANPSSPFFMEDNGRNTVHNLLLHTVTPLLAAVTWLLLDRAPVRWWFAAVWLGYPLVYLGFALVRGVFVDEYPYPFLDVNELGYNGVAITSLGFTVAFFLLGLLLIVLGAAVRRLLPASHQHARIEDPAGVQ